MSKQTPLQKKIQELQLRRLSAADRNVRKQSIDQVPSKKKSKPLQYKMQNTFAKNLSRLPGGGRVESEIRMVSAAHTGCIVRKENIGVLRSARNSNTTSGSYITTVIPGETDAQGRKVFGR